MSEDNWLLLIEDEDAVRSVLTRMLRELHFRVESVERGEEALERIQSRPERYGLVLVDDHMPGMGGLEVQQRLRRLRPELAVVLMGGAIDCDELEDLAERGPDAVLHKPFGLVEVRRVLARWMEVEP